MTNDELRLAAAEQLRSLGHEFIRRDLSDEALSELADTVERLRTHMHEAPVRTRTLPPHAQSEFALNVPTKEALRRQLFADSVVSGSANPMGLGAQLWRDGDVAVLEVELGNAFEGAPQRAHGGIVAALIDECLGLVLAMQQVLAFTVQLDISYTAPTPVNELLQARAWLESHVGRKVTMRCEVRAHDVVVAKATALFISVDPQVFLATAAPEQP